MRTTEAMSPSVPLAILAQLIVIQAEPRQLHALRRGLGRAAAGGRAVGRRTAEANHRRQAEHAEEEVDRAHQILELQAIPLEPAGERLGRHERVGAVHRIERAGRGHDDEELAGERHHRDDDVSALGERECEGVGAIELQPESTAKGRAGDERSRNAQIVEDGRRSAVKLFDASWSGGREERRVRAPGGERRQRAEDELGRREHIRSEL